MGVKRKKKRPLVKVVWYFPIIPYLKRLFANRANAELISMPNSARKMECLDTMLVACKRRFDAKYKEFKDEERNIRFGLSTFGMNPFGNTRSTHSTWPMTLCIYNLPPWMCMKRKYLMMPLLISGPNQPGNDIDVYLKPLVEDLLVLWKDGVWVCDEYRRENFTLYAMLFVTISDWPTLGNLSGQTVKGYNGCVQCLEKQGGWLTNS